MDSQHAETVVVAALLAMDKKPQVSANPRLIARTAVKALAEAGALIDGLEGA